MKNSRKKRAARERRVLLVALLVAAVIVTGSTFAWFTSKDEVTNRLSASANYGVSIAEDFQPHEDWIPGQPVNKDVSAVNTGNVDAFVRMWLEGEMSLIKRADNSKSVLDTNTTSLTATEDGDTMKKLGFLYHDNDRYYKVLSATERTNPALNGTNANVNDNDYSEVKTVQAGGYLVYAPKAADGYERWTYVTEQQETVVLNDDTTEVVAKDTKVGPVYSAGASKDIKGAPCKIDSDTFVPQTVGLYIFRRTIDLDANANTADHFEYSGYLFDGTNYFALYSDPEDGNSDYVLPEDAVTVATTTEPQKEPLTYTLDYDLIGFYTASETIVENSGLVWTYNSTNNVLTATYNAGTTTGDSATEDDVIIDVTLANIGTTGQTWVRQAPSAEGKMNTFYYNDDLEAGDTTAKLVDTVTLNKDVTQKAFLAFDFDLNVFLESVQVTLAENGNEMTTPVEKGGAFAGTEGNASPAYAKPKTAVEIADIEWN